MLVMVTGGREWNNWDVVYDALKQLPPGSIVMNGMARGLDTIVDITVLNRFGGVLSGVRYPAQWDKHGRAAGPIRNRVMLDQSPELILAFHDNLLTKSKGTKDAAQEGTKRGITVYHYTSQGDRALLKPEFFDGQPNLFS